MHRDMSSDLDDAFSSRDAGEVQLMPVMRTRMLRKPGLKPVFAPNGITKLRDAEGVERVTDMGPSPVRATGMAGLGMEVSLPIVGRVNLLHVGIAVGATLLACRLLKK